MKILDRAGNKYFKRKLQDSHRLGLPYEQLWDKAFRDFQRFQIGSADQGIVHCKDVENNLWKLLGNYDKFIPEEFFYILSLCCAFHDLGKTEKHPQVPHSARGAEIIKNEFVNSGVVNHQSTADAVSYITAAHEVGDFSFVPESCYVGDMKIYLKSCAAVFRLADMMSTGEDRAARLHILLKIPHDHLSTFVNQVRLNIQSCELCESDKRILEIYARFANQHERENIVKYVDGLNRDFTAEQQTLLQNIKTEYLSKTQTVKSRVFSLPYKFAIKWVYPYSFAGRNKVESYDKEKTTKQVIVPNIRRLRPSYFLNTETNLDIYQKLYDSVTGKRIVDPKFLYWTLRGASSYLSLSQNPFYTLNDIAKEFLLAVFSSEFYPIIKEKFGTPSCVLDLGVGDGTESNVLLNAIINEEKSSLKLEFFLIDFSYHLLKVAVNNIDSLNRANELYWKTIELITINEDIRDIQLFEQIINHCKSPRIFALLGGTLGNYFERDLLEPIQLELGDSDCLLLGVELIGGRSDEELRASYDSIFNRKFLHEPLSILGYEFEDSQFTVEVKETLSEVPQSKTIASWFNIDKASRVRLAISTKYKLESLESFIKHSLQMKVLHSMQTEDRTYGILLLQK